MQDTTTLTQQAKASYERAMLDERVSWELLAKLYARYRRRERAAAADGKLEPTFLEVAA